MLVATKALVDGVPSPASSPGCFEDSDPMASHRSFPVGSSTHRTYKSAPAKRDGVCPAGSAERRFDAHSPWLGRDWAWCSGPLTAPSAPNGSRHRRLPWLAEIPSRALLTSLSS